MPCRFALAGPAALAVSALVVACGGSSPNRSAAAKEQATEQKAEAKFADFAKCLREHGVDVELISHPGAATASS